MGLSEKDFGPDPLVEFGRWLEDAQNRSGQPNPNSMVLCTVGADGWPQGRPVLLKGWDARGLVFYTNSRSEKGRALAAHPRAEVVFHWDKLGRQLRARGEVQPLSPSETLRYFMTRPRASRLAAWASEQSAPVESREVMEARLAEQERRFAEREVELPPHWWGYRLSPWRWEFWQEGAFRFHDRFVYLRRDDGGWDFTRLYP
jgi:pyridoxamine 5'-phosphate oxidase